jgi:hypothetical protein
MEREAYNIEAIEWGKRKRYEMTKKFRKYNKYK